MSEQMETFFSELPPNVPAKYGYALKPVAEIRRAFAERMTEIIKKPESRIPLGENEKKAIAFLKDYGKDNFMDILAEEPLPEGIRGGELIARIVKFRDESVQEWKAALGNIELTPEKYSDSIEGGLVHFAKPAATKLELSERLHSIVYFIATNSSSRHFYLL